VLRGCSVSCRATPTCSISAAIRRKHVRRGQHLPDRAARIIRENYFADLVVFDARTIADRATFEKPNQPPAESIS
jgi:N-acyl-D-aspartate/D-glutamate deacylase